MTERFTGSREFNSKEDASSSIYMDNSRIGTNNRNNSRKSNSKSRVSKALNNTDFLVLKK